MNELIEKYFSFLCSEYNYKLVGSTKNKIVYENEYCNVIIEPDKDSITVGFKPNNAQGIYGLPEVLCYLKPDLRYFYDHEARKSAEDAVKDVANIVSVYCPPLLNGRFDFYDELKKYLEENWDAFINSNL